MPTPAVVLVLPIAAIQATSPGHRPRSAAALHTVHSAAALHTVHINQPIHPYSRRIYHEHR